MRVFAHRGLPEGGRGCGSNTPSDFIRAFQAGYDVEMDVRRWQGRLYVSHDPIMTLENQQPLPQFFDLLAQHPTRMALMGLKEDSMGREVHDLAKSLGVLERVVTFDNSIPDFVWNSRNVSDLQQMTRSSDYERVPWRGGYTLLDRWGEETPDEFTDRIVAYIKAARPAGKIVLISPELHWNVARWNFPVVMHDLRKAGLWGVITDEPKTWMGTQEPS